MRVSHGGIKNIPIRADRSSTKLSGVLETSPALFLQSVAFKLFEDRTFVPLFATRWFLLILCANRESNFFLFFFFSLLSSLSSIDGEQFHYAFVSSFFFPPSNDRRDRSRLIGSRIKSAASRFFYLLPFSHHFHSFAESNMKITSDVENNIYTRRGAKRELSSTRWKREWKKFRMKKEIFDDRVSFS